MIDRVKFDKIKAKFGEFVSWALWNNEDESDINIIEHNLPLLNVNWILIGLNISKPVRVWGNFRGGKHDRKLKIAFNNSFVRGSYMTDLIKKVEKSSTAIKKELKCDELDISKHVKSFTEELNTIGVNDKTKFIIFGNVARNIYDEYYERNFPENKVYYLNHYSSRSTDKQWVEKVWERLNIKLNFDDEKAKYTK